MNSSIEIAKKLKRKKRKESCNTWKLEILGLLWGVISRVERNKIEKDRTMNKGE